jgi:hypothetical protein
VSLSLGSIPGFTEIADTVFAAGATASDVSLKALNAAAKFGVIRNEQFWGYYKNGETVALPTSPADGYVYARNELVYTWSIYWTGAATGACAGTQVAPARGATSGAGLLLQQGYLVDQATGAVTCNASYFKTAQTDTNDGILLVMIHAQRQR